jgi:hypothetical protein
MPGTFAYTVDTNTVTQTGGTSGSPADFASFVTADRAGTGTSLLAAWAPNSNTKALTYQVRPVELLALLISFVVAGKTAETDYIFITGTDAWGAAQTESIDVSAGNGTYVSTKRWKTITNIDCSDNPAGGGTVWANGTVAVTQPIWGVIWNKGNGVYQLDCYLFSVGNGSTSTYFKTLLNTIIFKDGVATDNSQTCITVTANATLTDGSLVDAATRVTKDGSVWRLLESTYYNRNFIVNGTAYFYSSKFYGNGFNGRKGLMCYGTVYLYNTQIENYFTPNNLVNGEIYNYLYSGMGDQEAGLLSCSPTYAVDITVTNCDRALMTLDWHNLLLQNVIARKIGQYEFNNYDARGDRWLVNCDLGRDTWRIGGYGLTDAIHSTFRQYTLDLHITDLSGNNIAGATVILRDRENIEVFNVLSGADGKITFTGEDGCSVAKTVTHTRYYYSGGGLSDYRGPWTLTITKAGYQDYQDVITIDRKMDLEVAMLAAAGGAGALFLRRR